MRRLKTRQSGTLALLVATLLFTRPGEATDVPPDCPFCGVWALAQAPTVALQDVPEDHELLVQRALETLSFEMAFTPDGAACLRVERRAEVAFERIAWELAEQVGDAWRVRNITALGEPTEMVIELNGPDQLLLRQPARLAEALVFVRRESAAAAATWCDAQHDEVTP